MLGGLIRFSTRHRGVVIALGIVVLLWGLSTVARARLDIFPEFAPPQVSIQTEAPGLSPEQVELLVTKPIEDVIVGVRDLRLVRSQSIQGLSVVTAYLERGADVYRARQALAERLVEATARLPASVSPPVLTPLTSSSSTVLMVGITSATRPLMAQRTFADAVLRPRLLATPGVAKVAIFGGEVREIQVQLDPARLRLHRVSVPEAIAAAREATGLRGAGVVDDPNQRLTLRATGQPATAEELGAVVLKGGQGTVRLRDLGRVTDAPATAFGDGVVNGTPGLVLVVSAQLGANTKVVGAAVEAALERLRPALEAEGLVLHPPLFRPSEFVDLALRNVTWALLLGAVLVAVVLFLFLGDASTAAISLVAIPLSLLSAIIVLDAAGFSINTLTLGGLAIALGEVVDDAIIDVENIVRRLRLNRALPVPRPAAEVVLDASLEVRASVVYATLVVALVFLPVLALGGVQGALFRPLAYAYILATLASLVVALTVTPALTLALHGRRRRAEGPAPLLRWLARRYEPVLDWCLARPGAIGAVVAVACAATLALLPTFGASFLPEFREGHYTVHMSLVPGTSLAESRRLGQQVSAALLADPRVRSVAQRIGRAELSEDTWGTHYTEIEVDLVPLSGAQSARLDADLRALLAGFPGASFAIRGFLSERIEETLTGSTAQFVVHLFGDDLDSLDAGAQRLAARLRALPSAADVQYEPPAVAPELDIRLDQAAASLLGIRPEPVLATIEAATRGVVAAEVYAGTRPVAVRVVLAPEARATPEALARLPVETGRRTVELRDLATLERRSGRYAVAHVAGRRVQTVTANVADADLEAFADRLDALLATPGLLPPGIFAEVGGAGEARRETRAELVRNGALAAAGIMLLLAVAFGRPGQLLLVLANLPFALVGGVLSARLTGGILSIGSLVGFVTLFGIATRNAVMLVAHYAHLVEAEGAPWSPATARRGALERLGPILMTALVTGIALLPLALGAGDPGREIEGPMAIVILGGLVTSTALSLLVLPPLAARWVRFDGGPSVLAGAPQAAQASPDA